MITTNGQDALTRKQRPYATVLSSDWLGIYTKNVVPRDWSRGGSKEWPEFFCLYT